MATLETIQGDPTIGRFVQDIMSLQIDEHWFIQHESCCTAIGSLADLCFSVSTSNLAISDFLETTGQKAEDLQTHLQVWGADIGWASWSLQEKLSLDESVLRKSIVTAIRTLRRNTHTVAGLAVSLASPVRATHDIAELNIASVEDGTWIAFDAMDQALYSLSDLTSSMFDFIAVEKNEGPISLIRDQLAMLRVNEIGEGEEKEHLSTVTSLRTFPASPISYEIIASHAEPGQTVQAEQVTIERGAQFESGRASTRETGAQFQSGRASTIERSSSEKPSGPSDRHSLDEIEYLLKDSPWSRLDSQRGR